MRAKGGNGAVLWLAVKERWLRALVHDGDENPTTIRELTAETWGHGGGGLGLYLVDSVTEGRWGHSPGEAPYGGQTHPQGKAACL
ncbi:hypothetical protein OG978_20830 [Streptomyces sp. NBC_01591]|uniref:hypothetical protein n=1 Tax=Streptomyces sp. NBC_01591 TaxID=2975888 RepID=UPI002DD80B16|nr:hypothetical protein [Streptomyces sp. NBC_01591]WSD69617.1 hypothetical protein OG978_20830 [Streptomyces sp. NBC_01591]